jgi:hypothetical protein
MNGRPRVRLTPALKMTHPLLRSWPGSYPSHPSCRSLALEDFPWVAPEEEVRVSKEHGKFCGGAVLCIEGKSDIERIQVASRGRPLVRSPEPCLCA